MPEDRSRTGLSVSAIGAIVLLVSVSVPWYGVALTQRGASLFEQLGEQFAAEYGNAALQAKASADHATVAAFVGHQVTTLDAHQAHGALSTMLLVVGGLALVLALTAVVPAGLGIPKAGSEAIALLGALAALLCLYAIVQRPTAGQGAFSYSLEVGPWLALAASLLMVVGGLWPRRDVTQPSELQPQDAWSSLSGWTPDA